MIEGPFFVVVDIGCIECGECSEVLGIFTDEAVAEELLMKAEAYQKANGHRAFDLFKVDRLGESTWNPLDR